MIFQLKWEEFYWCVFSSVGFALSATEPWAKAYSWHIKGAAPSALIFSGKGDGRIETSTVQSKMERHEQLIRRASTVLKCTWGNLWREYFFWMSCLLCKYMELIQCWFVRVWTIAPEEYSWQIFQIQLLWTVPLIPLKAARTDVIWTEGTRENKKTLTWGMVKFWETEQAWNGWIWFYLIWISLSHFELVGSKQKEHSGKISISKLCFQNHLNLQVQPILHLLKTGVAPCTAWKPKPV